MTINGGQPHRVGYSGQPWVVTVQDIQERRRRIVCWLGSKPQDLSGLLASLETRPGWTDARCEAVANTETGEP